MSILVADGFDSYPSDSGNWNAWQPLTSSGSIGGYTWTTTDNTLRTLPTPITPIMPQTPFVQPQPGFSWELRTDQSPDLPAKPTLGRRISLDPVFTSCCRRCMRGTCSQHTLPKLFILAGQQAGCLDASDDLLTVELREGHRLVWDGRFPEFMHLHHEGLEAILCWQGSAQDDIEPEMVLAWLEAAHHGFI